MFTRKEVHGTMCCTWIACIVYIVSFSISPTEAQDCDFDGSILPFCGWTLGADGNGSGWKLTESLQNIVQNTDHTDPRVGKFIYLDAIVNQATKATLTSPEITILSDINFKFLYYMHGTEDGTLDVYIQGSGDTDNERKLIYTQRGDLGDAWNEVSIRISIPLKSRIIIEGVKASGHTGGVIGLDDFMVTNTSSIGNGSCDFETDDICGYRQVIPDEFDWVRQSGKTPTLGTGPPYDHTFNNASIAGFYMYTNASSHHEGNAARMSTPAVGPSSAICLSFWYYMYGDSSERIVGSLNVYKTDVDSDILTYSLLSLHGSQGNKWYKMKIDFPSNQEFQIVFEAIRGNSERSDIAIDDVKVVRHSFCNGSIVPSSFSRPRYESDGVKIPQTPTTRTFNPRVTGSSFMSTDTRQIQLHNPIKWHMNPRILTLIIVSGLSFWTIVFSLIFISIYRSYRLRKKEVFYQLERHDLQKKDEKHVSSANELVNKGCQSMYGLDLNIDTDTDPDEDVDVTELGVVGGIDFFPLSSQE